MLTTNGISYSCGKNDYGQICQKNTENLKIFTATLCQNNHGDMVKKICCGYYHTLLLFQSGIVMGFGRNDYGQLGTKINSFLTMEKCFQSISYHFLFFILTFMIVSIYVLNCFFFLLLLYQLLEVLHSDRIIITDASYCQNRFLFNFIYFYFYFYTRTDVLIQLFFR